MNQRSRTAAASSLLALLLGLRFAGAASDSIGPVPDTVRREFKLATFYQKFIDLDGLPVVGSTNVSDFALREAAWIVRQMLTNRPDILHAMASNHVRLAVMAWNEFTTDVPEHSDLESETLHNHVNTRAELKEYDPALAKLCAEVFGDNPWRYQKPAARAPEGRAHLAGYDASKAPRFKWRPAPAPDRPRVLIQTEIGDIEVELDARRAPVTVTNFLRYVHEGCFSDGSFFRTVTMDNQPSNKVKIQVIQAQANPAKTNEFFPPIPLERTRDTGLRHRDGTISMARDGPDTAQENFFICIGDQPELDFGGKRNPDGQGFAAFGKVTKGMDVVRRIHEGSAEGQRLAPPIRIQRAIRLN